MRRFPFAAISAVALLVAAGTTSAVAQDYPWCLQGKDWGYPGQCQFSTCLPAASGTFSTHSLRSRTSDEVIGEEFRNLSRSDDEFCQTPLATVCKDWYAASKPALLTGAGKNGAAETRIVPSHERP
jgi:Protein of unknown function (DUF3551)